MWTLAETLACGLVMLVRRAIQNERAKSGRWWLRKVLGEKEEEVDIPPLTSDAANALLVRADETARIFV